MTPRTSACGSPRPLLQRIATAVVGGAAAALLVGGCGAVYHLHPRTGQSYYKVMRLHRSAPFPQPQMIGDDAETALENLDKASRASEMKKSGGTGFLLPLQR